MGVSTSLHSVWGKPTIANPPPGIQVPGVCFSVLFTVALTSAKHSTCHIVSIQYASVKHMNVYRYETF